MNMAQKYRIKKHFRNNRTTYAVGAGCLAVGIAAGMLLMSKNANGVQALQQIRQIGFRNETNPVMINLIERSTPSTPVHLIGSNKYFDSINEAARQTGHSASMISRNVNGHISDVKGDVFEVLEKAA